MLPRTALLDTAGQLRLRLVELLPIAANVPAARTRTRTRTVASTRVAVPSPPPLFRLGADQRGMTTASTPTPTGCGRDERQTLAATLFGRQPTAGTGEGEAPRAASGANLAPFDARHRHPLLSLTSWRNNAGATATRNGGGSGESAVGLGLAPRWARSKSSLAPFVFGSWRQTGDRGSSTTTATTTTTTTLSSAPWRAYFTSTFAADRATSSSRSPLPSPFFTSPFVFSRFRGGSTRSPPPPPPRSSLSARQASDNKPLNRLRRRIDRFNPDYVLYALIGLNVAVWLVWQYAHNSWQRFGDPRPFQFMVKNFLSGEPNLREGRIWTLLTSCISHDSTGHLFVNLLGLFFMGQPVIHLLGSARFLALYFGAGTFSSLVSLTWHRLFDRGSGRSANLREYSHGASGAIYAVMTTFAAMYPNATFLIFFVIPAPAWACVGGLFAWDLYSAWRRPGSQKDSAGHLGGILAGLLFYRFRIRGGGVGRW